MVDHKICSDHIGLFKSHRPIFSLGVRRLYARWGQSVSSTASYGESFLRNVPLPSNQRSQNPVHKPTPPSPVLSQTNLFHTCTRCKFEYYSQIYVYIFQVFPLAFVNKVLYATVPFLLLVHLLLLDVSIPAIFEEA